MNHSTFLSEISKLKKNYKWSVDKRGRIVGKPVNHADKAKVKTYNPITALARSTRVGQYKPSKTKTALNKLGIEQNTQQSLIAAVNNSCRRGQSQVMRGRIKKVLGL